MMSEQEATFDFVRDPLTSKLKLETLCKIWDVPYDELDFEDIEDEISSIARGTP